MLNLNLDGSVLDRCVAIGKRRICVGVGVWTRGDEEESCSAAGKEVGCSGSGVGPFDLMCTDLFCV